MTVVYFKKNGICYSYDNAGSASVPPPGAIIVDTPTDTYDNCEDCCPAPCACPYTISDPQPSSITVTMNGTYRLYPQPNCQGPEIILSPGTTATLSTFSACSWRGSTTGGDRVFNIEVKLVNNGSDDCYWEASIYNDTTIVALKKYEGGIVDGDYGSGTSVCGSLSDKLIITSFSVAA